MPQRSAVTALEMSWAQPDSMWWEWSALEPQEVAQPVCRWAFAALRMQPHVTLCPLGLQHRGCHQTSPKDP